VVIILRGWLQPLLEVDVGPGASLCSRRLASRAATATVKRGAPAVTSPVRRPAPSTRPATSTPRTAARSTGTTAKPKAAGKSVALVAKTAGGPVARVTEGRLCTPVDNLGTLTRRCAYAPPPGG
jgi:hypothetical protein